MARYALVEDNKAVNIVEWDGDVSKWEPPSGQIAVAIGSSGVGIVNHYYVSRMLAGVNGARDKGFSGFTCKYLGKDSSGIHFLSETKDASSGVNGFG